MLVFEFEINNGLTLASCCGPLSFYQPSDVFTVVYANNDIVVIFSVFHCLFTKSLSTDPQPLTLSMLTLFVMALAMFTVSIELYI